MRRTRTERVVAYGRRYSNTKTAGPIGRAVRDLFLPFVFSLQARGDGPTAPSWLFEHTLELPAMPAEHASAR